MRAWLVSLAEDPGARSAVVRQTLDGTVRSLARQAHGLADALTQQLGAADALREAATTAYAAAEERAVTAATDGTLLRGEVAVRWREFAGNGELLRSLEGRVGLIRDRLVNAVKGSGQQAERVAVAIESAVELMVARPRRGRRHGDRRGLGRARHRRPDPGRDRRRPRPAPPAACAAASRARSGPGSSS